VVTLRHLQSQLPLPQVLAKSIDLQRLAAWLSDARQREQQQHSIERRSDVKVIKQRIERGQSARGMQ
jgi:hypothetical protein